MNYSTGAVSTTASGICRDPPSTQPVGRQGRRSPETNYPLRRVDLRHLALRFSAPDTPQSPLTPTTPNGMRTLPTCSRRSVLRSAEETERGRSDRMGAIPRPGGWRPASALSPRGGGTPRRLRRRPETSTGRNRSPRHRPRSRQGAYPRPRTAHRSSCRWPHFWEPKFLTRIAPRWAAHSRLMFHRPHARNRSGSAQLGKDNRPIGLLVRKQVTKCRDGA